MAGKESRVSGPVTFLIGPFDFVNQIVLCCRLADGGPFFGQLTYRFRLSRT